MFTTIDKAIAGFVVTFICNVAANYAHIAVPSDVQSAGIAFLVALLVWLTPNLPSAVLTASKAPPPPSPKAKTK